MFCAALALASACSGEWQLAQKVLSLPRPFVDAWPLSSHMLATKAMCGLSWQLAHRAASAVAAADGGFGEFGRFGELGGFEGGGLAGISGSGCGSGSEPPIVPQSICGVVRVAPFGASADTAVLIPTAPPSRRRPCHRNSALSPAANVGYARGIGAFGIDNCVPASICTRGDCAATVASVTPASFLTRNRTQSRSPA